MKKLFSLLLCAALSLSLLAACSSDYPVIDRKLDIAGLINACFAGSGYSIDLPSAEITVSAVADRMSVDMDQSEKAIDSIRAAVRKATSTGSGLIGTWSGKVDISPAICACLVEIPKITVSDYFHDIWVDAELTFTENGIYMLRFPKESVVRAREQMLAAGAATTKGYLSSSGSAVAKIVGSALSDDSISDILFYVVNFAESMLESGSAGYYSVSGSTLTLDDSHRFTFTLELAPSTSAPVSSAPETNEKSAQTPASEVNDSDEAAKEETSSIPTGDRLILTPLSKNMEGMASILAQGAEFAR